jgi:cyclic dehypoxanthinyl futalosine synthase
MFSAIRSTLEQGGRVERDAARFLYEKATDDELQELSSIVRGRFHRPRTATWLKMAIINTTNVCVARCDYCSFYRWPGTEGTYTLTIAQICGRIDELKSHGGTLVGFNGGFHPDLGVDFYCELFSTIRQKYPDLEFYEMTVAEFMFVAKRGNLTYAEAAERFAASGTRWITGGGAEVLDDDFRMRHSPGKYKVEDYYDAQTAILEAGIGSTATMVIGFDETLDERLNHLFRLRRFQDTTGGLPSFLCWTYKPWNNDLGGHEVTTEEYLRWLAVSRIVLDNIEHVRTSVLTQNARALEGLLFGADDFDLPTEDEVTQKAGATVSHAFEQILDSGRVLGFELNHRDPLPVPKR